MDAPETAPAGHPRRWAILAVLVISLLVVVLDNTILNVALRTIADPVHGLGATQSELEWAINSYTLVFAGLLFTAGILADRVGRRITLVTGLAIFAIASLISSYADTANQLIAARALMGLGAAAVMPATLSIIANVFTPQERPRAIGIWAGAVGLGVAIGPILGGLLLENFWWGSVFLINVPIAAAGVFLVFFLVPESRDPRPNRIDIPGVLLSIVGLTLLTYGVIEGGEAGFGDPKSWGTLAGAVVVLAAFVAWELRTKFPSLDVRLFRNRTFSASTGVIGLVFFAAMGAMFFGAFYLQLVRGYGPLASGALFVPFAVAQMVFAPRSAAMVKRFGPKAVGTVGLLLVAAGLGVWLFIGQDTPIWVVGAAFFVMGVGMANVMPPATESIMAALPREKAGVGSAVSNTIRQLGGALGVAVLGAVLSSVYRDNLGTATDGLPAGAADTARESISGAYGVAEQAGAAAPALLQQANSAFLDAMHYAAIGSMVFALLGAVVAVLWLPGKRPATAAPTAVAASETGQERKAPGRPRNAQADEAILHAVLDLLSEGQSVAAISIEAVAARAGVGKATIYRRWPNKEALLIDAVAAMKGPLPEPAGVSVRDDLVMLVKANRSGHNRRYGKVTACLLPELVRDDELLEMYQAVVEPRRAVMRGVLLRGIETGELRADLDVELTLLMITGPSMMHGLFRWNPRVPEEGFVEALVDAILRGARA